MRAEVLLTMAAAQGIDLRAMSGQKSGRFTPKKDTKSQMRRGIKSVVLQEATSNKAKGTGERSTVRPEWTVAEIGMAAMGVPKIEFLAALFAFAGDHSVQHDLHTALLQEAERLSRERHWPDEVIDLYGIGRPYLKHLAMLVLFRDAYPNEFVVCQELPAIFLGIKEKTWGKHMAARYNELQSIWNGWLSNAARTMQPRLEAETA
jgi:hypothetical protein